MNTQPCICPTNAQGLRTTTDPKCFDHAPWNRHPSNYVVKLRIPRKVKIAALTLTAAASMAALSAAPASAADPYIWVCNSLKSYDNIEAYNTSVSGYGRKSINQGDCKSINDRSGNARVDVDPAGGEADIDSYRIYTDHYPFGGSPTYGPCHEGENGASNPDSSGVTVSHYVTSDLSGCK